MIPQGAWPYALVFARVSVFMATSPVFFPGGSPRALKAVLTLAFTAALAPMALTGPQLDPQLPVGVLMLLREALIGAVLGTAVQLPFAALRGAGALMDMQTGLSMAHMVDPSMGESQTALSSFFGLLSVLIFLSLDGHLWLLKGLSASFTALPPGGAWPRIEGFGAWISMSGMALGWALQIAAPILALLLMTEFFLGLVSKMLPQLNLLILGQPVRFAAGLGAAAVLMGFLGPLSERLFTEFIGKWQSLIAAL